MSKLKWLCLLLISLLVVAAIAWAFRPTVYTAKASLLLARCQPSILPSSTEKYDPVEFEMFCDTQAQLIKTRWVIIAALRDPSLKGRACVRREDDRHNAIQWLTNAIHVDRPNKSTGVIEVSVTQTDREDAAAMVNAVVGAYWNEVVYSDRKRLENRLAELHNIHTEKENEVRTKREQLKRELEQIGLADDQTTALRIQSAAFIYFDARRRWQQIEAEKFAVDGKYQETKDTLDKLSASQIPGVDVVMFLNSNPVYLDLKNRLMNFELNKLHAIVASPGTKQPPDQDAARAEREALKERAEQMEREARDMIAESKRIALETELQHLNSQREILTAKYATFEKQVEKKRIEAEEVGKSSIGAQMMKPEVEDLERVVRTVADEQQRLTLELRAPPRVTIPGNTAPDRCADVPESPD